MAPLNNKKLLGTPGFIGDVWPQPYTSSSLLCYAKSTINLFGSPPTGIAVKIYRTQEIVDLEAVDGKEDLPEFDKRIFFYLDGAELPMIKLFESGGAYLIIGESGRKFIPVAGEYLYGASPFLLPGEHTMKVLIKTKAGKVLEYEWYFFIK